MLGDLTREARDLDRGVHRQSRAPVALPDELGSRRVRPPTMRAAGEPGEATADAGRRDAPAERRAAAPRG